MEQVRGTWKLLSFVIYYRQSDAHANQTTDTTEQQTDKRVHREVTVQMFYFIFLLNVTSTRPVNPDKNMFNICRIILY